MILNERIKLDPKFSFNKMAFEIYKLLEEKAVTASTIRNFYLRRTTPRKKTIEAIQRCVRLSYISSPVIIAILCIKQLLNNSFFWGGRIRDPQNSCVANLISPKF